MKKIAKFLLSLTLVSQVGIKCPSSPKAYANMPLTADQIHEDMEMLPPSASSNPNRVSPPSDFELLKNAFSHLDVFVLEPLNRVGMVKVYCNQADLGVIYCCNPQNFVNFEGVAWQVDMPAYQINYLLRKYSQVVHYNFDQHFVTAYKSKIIPKSTPSR